MYYTMDGISYGVYYLFLRRYRKVVLITGLCGLSINGWNEMNILKVDTQNSIISTF